MKKVRLAVRLVCISVIVIYFTGIEQFPSDRNILRVKYAVGNDLYFIGADKDEAVTYHFLLNVNENDEELRQVIEKSKDSIELDGGKYTLIYYSSEISGGQHAFLQLSNYQDQDISDRFDNMCIWGGWEHRYGDTIYDAAQTYTWLEDIRYLSVDAKVDQNAAEGGIDWFAVWDTLESCEVIE